jgi:hypothetical protein
MIEVSMDERLQKALDFSKYRIALFNRKEDLKIKVNNMLIHAHNGGIFKASQELISFVKLLIDAGKTTVVLIDVNGNPIQILDTQVFFNDILSKYFEATNYYHVEYTKIRSARSVTSIYEFVND